MVLRETYEKYKRFKIPSLSVICEKSSRYSKIYLFVIVILFLIFIYLIQQVPHWQVAKFEINNSIAVAQLENSYRATLAQILGGAAIGIGLYYTWRRITIAEKELKATQENLEITQKNLAIAQENLKVSQEGQITERFTRAIDQLGNKKLEIRLGGIYALERIANESKKDYWPIIEILAAFSRKNSPIENKNIINKEVDAPKKLPLDIQAILTVIRRCKPSFNTEGTTYLTKEPNYPTQEAKYLIMKTDYLDKEIDNFTEEVNYLDLHETYLWKANLYNAYLKGANLKGANLSEANLYKVNLQMSSSENVNFKKALFYSAKLEGAFFMGAHFEDAQLSYAILKYSFFTGAHLERAILQNADLELTFFLNAHLEGAQLFDTNLKKAILSEANLQGAFLRSANLEGANLRGANLEGVDFYNANLKGANLEGANLQGAKNLTIDQLFEVFSLYSAKLDEELEVPLREKYNALFDKPDSGEFLKSYF